MAKIISLFNHKGGVSKTTTTFNLGWSLANTGKKVLLIDTDAQCNLTSVCISHIYEEIDEFYTKSPQFDNFYKSLKEFISGNSFKPSTPALHQTKHPNMEILLGSPEIWKLEEPFCMAIQMRDSDSLTFAGTKKIPGSLNLLISDLIEKHGFDYVLIDMSPALGAFNQCLLMSSNYFIIPTFPDYFSYQALVSLSEILPNWGKQVENFRKDRLGMPQKLPKLLGIIYQAYRPYNKKKKVTNSDSQNDMAGWYKHWKDKMSDAVNTKLVPKLGNDMLLNEEIFKQHIKNNKPYNLIDISNFNSLLTASQEHGVPVFELTDDQINRSGTVLKQMKESRDNFKKTFEELAQIAIGITSQ